MIAHSVFGSQTELLAHVARIHIIHIAVYDYLEKVLQAPGMDYVLDKNVLCAADYGAPQKRMRFVIIGMLLLSKIDKYL